MKFGHQKVLFMRKNRLLFIGTLMGTLMGTFIVANCVIAEAQQGGFGEADADGNQKVSALELKEYVGGKMPGFDRFDELMTGLDSDGDGAISNAEFGKRMEIVRTIMQREPRDGKDKTDEIREFTERYDLEFAQHDPKQGAVMGDIVALDAQGNEFHLDSTRGKYTVIVFGCLT
jgi:hypothetical protein